MSATLRESLAQERGGSRDGALLNKNNGAGGARTSSIILPPPVSDDADDRLNPLTGAAVYSSTAGGGEPHGEPRAQGVQYI